jgi:hypothetical protein
MKLVWKRPDSQKVKTSSDKEGGLSFVNWKELSQMITDHYEKEKLDHSLKQHPNEKKRIF